MQKRTIIAGFGIATLLVAAGTAGANAAGLITTSQIKNGAVTSAKVKDGTLTLRDFKASERTKLRGPAGFANTTLVQSPTVTVAANDSGTVIAFCPAGTKVTGGGYYSDLAVAAASLPNNRNSWGVVINNFANSFPVDVNAFAVCA